MIKYRGMYFNFLFWVLVSSVGFYVFFLFLIKTDTGVGVSDIIEREDGAMQVNRNVVSHLVSPCWFLSPVLAPVLVVAIFFASREILTYGSKKCPNCGKRFSLKEKYVRDDWSLSDAVEVRYRCRYCGVDRGYRIIEKFSVGAD